LNAVAIANKAGLLHDGWKWIADLACCCTTKDAGEATIMLTFGLPADEPVRLTLILYYILHFSLIT